MGSRAAGTIATFDVSAAFSGAQSQGIPPFIHLEFDDAIAPGAVRMTASAPGLNASEWVALMHLNVDPAIAPTDLFFSNFVIHSGTMLQPIISRGANAFEADAGGFFDLQFQFSVSGGGFTRRWNLGESFSFDITGPPELNANSFGFFSAAPAANGVQALSLLIQGIGANAEEGYHSVPEPGAGALALLALTALARRRCR
jgi:MYXO-CTERM domain-containing protein